MADPIKTQTEVVSNAMFLKDRLSHGKPGDYIVTSQGKMVTVLMIKAVTSSSVILEEISAVQADVTVPSWKDWIAAKAPGHTSWTAYEVDLATNRIIFSYSYSQGMMLSTQDPDNFLTTLLSLPLKPVPAAKQKRVGPPPSGDEDDHRSIWKPPVVVEGKKIEKPSVEPWSAKWPDDRSPISGCEIELYLGSSPFPYWITIKTPHYKASIHAIDSGQGANSPMALPQRNTAQK
jgi:hypothetical protein